MFCRLSSTRRRHAFIYNTPGQHSLVGGAGVELYYADVELLRTALYLRQNAAPHLQTLSVSDVEQAITSFVASNFWIIGDEAWEGCALGAGHASDAPFAAFLSEKAKSGLAAAMGASSLYVEPRDLTVFPLVVVRVEAEFDGPDFFLVGSAGLRPERLPPSVPVEDMASETFPPVADARRTWGRPASWLGIWAGTLEIAKRDRAAVLGALALLPHHMQRYMFTGRTTFGGRCTFSSEGRTTSNSDPHTPPLAEDVVIGPADHAWLNVLAAKLRSPTKAHRRQMRALEYYYRAWAPDPVRRFPTLFGALDAIYGDAGQATQSVIDAVGPVMGSAYDYERLRLLLSLRGSVIHGGAPNVYESRSYHRYYERYEEDATRDLDLIVARCLQGVVFGGAMTERPHTHAAVIKEHTGRDV